MTKKTSPTSLFHSSIFFSPIFIYFSLSPCFELPRSKFLDLCKLNDRPWSAKVEQPGPRKNDLSRRVEPLEPVERSWGGDKNRRLPDISNTTTWNQTFEGEKSTTRARFRYTKCTLLISTHEQARPSPTSYIMWGRKIRTKILLIADTKKNRCCAFLPFSSPSSQINEWSLEEFKWVCRKIRLGRRSKKLW